MSSLAHAANIACSGSYLGYDFNVTTRTSGRSVTSAIKLVITNGGSVVTQSSLSPSSSDIRPGQYLKFAGSNADGAGSINTVYDAGSQSYRGTLEAQSAKTGAVGVDIVCSLSGTRPRANSLSGQSDQYEQPDAYEEM